MDVAAGYRIADPKKLEPTIGVVEQSLGSTFGEGTNVDLAKVPRSGLQREVELVARQRSMFRDHLVNSALFFLQAVFVT